MNTGVFGKLCHSWQLRKLTYLSTQPSFEYEAILVSNELLMNPYVSYYLYLKSESNEKKQNNYK